MIRNPLIPCSTPILPDSIKVESDFVTPSKLECRKNVGLVPSPLKNAYFKKTLVKAGVVLPLETKNCFPKQYDSDECPFLKELSHFHMKSGFLCYVQILTVKTFWKRLKYILLCLEST